MEIVKHSSSSSSTICVFSWFDIGSTVACEIVVLVSLVSQFCYETSIFISFLDYWQVTLIWSPNGDDSLIHSLLIDDTSTIYYTDVAIRVTMTLY